MRTIEKQQIKTKETRIRHLKREYGMSINEFDALLKKQGSVCAICQKTEPNGHNLAVDHDHTTGKIRGLLCSFCNRTLGLIGDDIKIARAIVKYLR